jgi:hypothetical protein
MSYIKVKAWNKDLNKFFYVSNSFSISLHDTGNTVIMWSSDGIVDEFPADEVIQSTCLTAPCGREIWFGDFYYNAGYGNLHINTMADIVTLIEGLAENDIGDYLGNQYQNPELLKDQS